MKHSALIIFIFFIAALPNRGFCQFFYAKFQSDTAKVSHTCNLYVSGYKDNNVFTTTISVPFNGFFPFKCESTKSLYLTVDCIPVGFIVNETFNCGDSIIINVDNRSVKYINRK